MTKTLGVQDLDLKGKRVLLRVDFNVPLEKGEILDDTRIQASLPTIQYILDQGGSVVLMSHLGRPKGGPDPRYSLAPCVKRLSELLDRPVNLLPDCVGPEVSARVKRLQPGEVIVLENLRFHKGEEKPTEEPTFASALAELGDLYVDDAFGCAHRAHASITEVPALFPGRAAAGFLLQKEITYLGETLLKPKKPFYAILGGAKISTKFKVIEILLTKADLLLVGGAMSYTFFKAQGLAIGNSLYEPEFVDTARQLLQVSSQERCPIWLPVDLVIVQSIDPQSERRIVPAQDGIPEGFQGVDIGPETVKRYTQALQDAGTVFWNGPLGVFECHPFDAGTNAIARTLAELSAVTIVGGGESVAAVDRAGVADRLTHLSTGGGASLEYIEFGQLPGIEALSKK